MALSQLQCLDDNHVNPRTHESKPEFFYCEDQRLALEALLRDGREGFAKFLEARGLRGFLSDPEMEILTRSIEPYDPGSELFSENAGDEPVPLSLHYWPDESDVSIPNMDLGWPDSEAYRGVTRTTLYTQPPMDGQAHIKEVVRKIIAQAQKVIAVVMDVFTDVDIFRDLMDAGFKRKVSIYILLERTNLPHFLSMCQRASIHRGHLKQLRVRCTEGAEFHTHSCTKVSGQMGHRFMFVDGDKAVSGSYSFTWMSSRLDRNLITVTTGQAVNGFDQLFRFLFANSRHVDLRQITKESEPEPEPLPQPTAVAPPPADVARKLYNPKYALVMATNPSPTTSVDPECPKEPETSEDPKIRRRKNVIEEAAPPKHPGLMNLEKASLISYLPIWPEPDPPSDVIGFINIRDARKPTQVHLQRSEMFETSQAIRFSSPFTKAEEPVPKELKPRNFSSIAQEIDRFQPKQNKTTVNDAQVENVQPRHVSVTKEVVSSKENTPGRTPTLAQPERHDNKPVNTDISQNPGSKLTNLNPSTLPQSGSKKLVPEQGASPFTTQTLTTNSSSSDFIQKLNNLNTRSNTVYKPHPLNTNSAQTFQMPSKQDTQEKMTQLHLDLQKKMANAQPKKLSPASAFEPHLSMNNHTFTTTPSTTTATAAVSSSPLNPTLNSSPLPSFRSSSSNLDPPVAKPRTVQLLIKDSSNNNSPIHNVKKPNTRADPESNPPEPPKETTKPIALQNDLDETSEAQNSGKKEAQQQNESMKYQEAKSKDVIHQHDVEINAVPEKTLQTPSYASFKLTAKTDGKRESMKTNETKPNTFLSTNSKVVPKTQSNTSSESFKKSPFTMSINSPDVSDPVHSVKTGTLPNVLATNKQHTNKANDALPKLTCGADIIFEDHVLDSTKNHTHCILPEESDKVESNTHTFERNTLPSTHVREWRSPTPEHEPITPLKQTPTFDRFPTRSPTPDSCTSTLDPRSFTPDFRTPTPDISDGYISSREDSNLSTTSDEYYECSESPNIEPVFNLRLYPTPNLAEDHTSFTHKATNFSATGTTPTNINYSSGDSEWNTLISDSQALTKPSRDHSSSPLEKKAKTKRTNDVSKEVKGKVEDRKGWKPDMAQRVPGDSLEIEKKDNEVTKQDRSLTETGDHTKELPASQKQRVLNKSTASQLVVEEVTAGEPAIEGTESNRSTDEGRKPETIHQREKASKASPGKEKVSSLVPPKASGAERREKILSKREAGEEKQQESDTSSSPRPPRSPRSISISQYLGARPWGGRQLNQTESKVLEVLEGPSSPHNSQARPSPSTQGPAVAAAGQRQVSQSQQGLSRQPPTAQSRTRTGITSNQASLAKLPASSAQTNASMNPPPQSHSQSQLPATQQGSGQDDGKIAFNFTLSKLYNLKGLKEKLSKGPQQNKKNSPTSPGEGQKNSS